MSAPDVPYKVVVTGFGPFEGHEELNASWEAVRQLPAEHRLSDGRLCHLHVQKIDVGYQAVDEAVKAIWAGQPDLVIHCGVNERCSTIALECHAYNGNFCRPDWTGQHLETNSAVQLDARADCKQLSTRLNVDRIVGELKECHPEVEYASSTDVGNYLCGYIYFKSLDHNADRTLFVHVPPVDKPFSTAATSRSLLHTVEKCVHNINSRLK